MPTKAFSPEVDDAIRKFMALGSAATTATANVDGVATSLLYPFPSPKDWRDCWIYFLITDRFNNPSATPKFTWNKKYGFRQGGTFEGIRQQLGYLQELGVNAIWISPVLKNTRPEIDGFAYAYPGYNTQDFFNLDERFASDGTSATAELELKVLVNEAHARGIHVIVDIVLNHTGRVFDYVRNGHLVDSFTDANLLAGPPGNEPSIQWMNGFGVPRGDWQDVTQPAGAGPDDLIWPVDLQRPVFFRRRGSKVSDKPGPQGFAPGDFSVMRQMVVEYDASVAGQEDLRRQYGVYPVLGILIRAYQYLIAKYDIDGFRIDTVKYVQPSMVETFCNAMREFALSGGKANFLTFGEIYDSEDMVERFVGRNTQGGDGFGMDSALDFPLFFQLPAVIKSLGGSPPGVENIAAVFNNRKLAEANQVSSHGEAGKYFVSFIDNHDQNGRFNSPGTPEEQVTMALALILTLQGIPCVYYGTEQGLQGTVDGLDAMESVREALWGRPDAFDRTAALYQHLQQLAALRRSTAALRYGRVYFRAVSGDGIGFGQSTGPGGLIAFSRILVDTEVVVIANTSGSKTFTGEVLIDVDLCRSGREMRIAYSNKANAGKQNTTVKQAKFYDANGQITGSGEIGSLPVQLAPWEVQVLAPSF